MRDGIPVMSRGQDGRRHEIEGERRVDLDDVLVEAGAADEALGRDQVPADVGVQSRSAGRTGVPPATSRQPESGPTQESRHAAAAAAAGEGP